MLALWALFLLSAMIITWTLDIDGRITLSGNANRALEAVAMACSGSEVALHPAVQPRGSGPAAPDRQKPKLFRADYRRRWAIEFELARSPAKTHSAGNCCAGFWKAGNRSQRTRSHDRLLLDWVDPDNLVRLNGAETSENYKPANRPFTRMEDLRKVKGWGEFTSNPGWDDILLALIGHGPVDITWASRDILLALPGMTPEIVDRSSKLAERRGWNRWHDGRSAIQIARRCSRCSWLSPDQFSNLRGW